MTARSVQLVTWVSVLAVGGCSATLNQPAGVTYAKSVEQLGIIPVYPPREDLQVGDLYAIENHSHEDRLRARTGYLDTVDLTADIRDYLSTRYKFKQTNTGVTPIAATSQSVPQLEQIDAFKGRIPGKSDLETLPITGFPEIEVDSGITVGVSGQPKGLAAVFGFEAAKTLKMSLRFGEVTSYAVPAVRAAQRLDGYCASPVTQYNCTTSSLNYIVNLKYGLDRKDPDGVKSSHILMVDKVYLARQITYTFNDATLAAAVVASQGSAGAVPTISASAVDKALASGDSAMLGALAELQTSLNGAVAKQPAEGGGVSFAGVNKNAVSFNVVFARPVVIGYEAVTLAGSPG